MEAEAEAAQAARRRAELAQPHARDADLEALLTSFVSRMPESTAIPFQRVERSKQIVQRSFFGRTKATRWVDVPVEEARGWVLSGLQREVRGTTSEGMTGGDYVSLAVATDGEPWLVAWSRTWPGGRLPRRPPLTAAFLHSGPSSYPNKLGFDLGPIMQVNKIDYIVRFLKLSFKDYSQSYQGHWPSGQPVSGYANVSAPDGLIEHVGNALAAKLESVEEA